MPAARARTTSLANHLLPTSHTPELCFRSLTCTHVSSLGSHTLHSVLFSHVVVSKGSSSASFHSRRAERGRRDSEREVLRDDSSTATRGLWLQVERTLRNQNGSRGRKHSLKLRTAAAACGFRHRHVTAAECPNRVLVGGCRDVEGRVGAEKSGRFEHDLAFLVRHLQDRRSQHRRPGDMNICGS